MARKRCSDLRDTDWLLQITDDADGITLSVERIQAVLLWEILQELKQLNSLLSCTNFTSIPATLRGLRRDLQAAQKERAK